ncbi:MAG: threonine synthase [Lachnospiraceae bacterium]|nr:threonine synthase [Lachnospiraceae bacterium]
MEVLYKSTRSDSAPISASKAILKGLSDDGGLFVPTFVPALDWPLKDFASMSYQETAYQVMKLLLTDYTEEELRGCIERAYDEKFDIPEITRLHKTSDAWYLELYHGATIAFKDMALSILPHLMITAAKKNHEDKEIVILTATSGDTGKAALAGFAGVEGTKIIVFYPKDGVSSIQERQMVTQKGDNTCVIGIKGNFDDAQNGVKKIFTDRAMKEELAAAGYQFSSANSINIGRLVPQIVYYVYSYGRLLKDGVIKAGDPVNFVVPTGNFGNILAAFYAMKMGLPVGKLICASNSNKVLFDFFRTGSYDRNRDFILTSSPSMDILISSNLERLIYFLTGNDAGENAALMKDLTEKGVYTVTEQMREKMDIFYGGYADEEATAAQIRRIYEKDGYVLDPHTAVASAVYDQYLKETGDRTPSVIDFTASPFKFERAVMKALGQPSDMSDLDLADKLSEVSGDAVPEAVNSLRTAEVLHKTVCGKEGMADEVRKFLGLGKSCATQASHMV